VNLANAPRHNKQLTATLAHSKPTRHNILTTKSNQIGHYLQVSTTTTRINYRNFGVTNAADPLRIVLVAPPYFDIPPKGYGGVEVVVAELADALLQRGHDVTVLGAGEPRTSARLIPVWECTLADRLGEPYPEIMHALKPDFRS
jgi:hypothetical protein